MARLTQPLHSGFSSLHYNLRVSSGCYRVGGQDRHTLILRFLQLVQPPLDLLCDRRGLGNVAGMFFVYRSIGMWWKMEGSKAGRWGTRDT
jgi:hypothetical protein